jgi:hypothetical protein
MRVLTREQREGLKRVFDRPLEDSAPYKYPPSYLQFRRSVQTTGYDSCVMIKWCNIWLGIETDGYTHS